MQFNGKINNLNALLWRLGYKAPESDELRESQLSISLLANLYGCVDPEQLVRCGFYSSYPVSRVSLTKMASKKKPLLARARIPDGCFSAYNGTKEFLNLLPENADVRRIVKTLLSRAAKPSLRAHDVCCANTGLALTASGMERFYPMFGQLMLRGVSSINGIFRATSKEGLFVNSLAPDLIIKKHIGALFFEIDRNTERVQVISQKFTDYFEVFRSVDAEELSECVVIVAAFDSRKEKNAFTIKKKSFLENPGKELFEGWCLSAAHSLGRRAKDAFQGPDFLKSVFSGLRFLIVPGHETWSPSSLERYLPKECSCLCSILGPVLTEHFDAEEYAVGAMNRTTGGSVIRFPQVVFPANSATQSVIFENISADICGRERALRLITSRDFIRPETSSRSLLVMEVETESDAERFLSDVAATDAALYPKTDFGYHMLLSEGIYRTFHMELRNGEPWFFVKGFGFIFLIGDRFFLPQNEGDFRRIYLEGTETFVDKRFA